MSTKPLDVMILSKVQGHEDLWESYQEYGEKTKGSTKDWSCYILAKEGELFSVRCTNPTKDFLAVRISVDTCCVQQYLLRPRGDRGDTVTCDGTGSNSMVFDLVSALDRAGHKNARQPSETGCINVTVYKPALGTGRGLPSAEKPPERLGLPVSMDGTFWKLCVRLTGEHALGEPSPHAAEIGGLSWRRFATLDFNYRTEDELFSGRIRGIPLPQKQGTSADTSSVYSSGKRKRESMGDGASRRRRNPFVRTGVASSGRRTFSTEIKPAPSTSDSPEPRMPATKFARKNVITSTPVSSRQSSSSMERSPTPQNPKLEMDVVMTLSGESVTTGLESPPFIPWPQVHTLRANSNVSDDLPQHPASQPPTEPPSDNPPTTCETGPGFPEPEPEPELQPQPSLVAPTITPHDDPKPEQSTAASIDEADHIPTLAAFLNEVDPHTPLGFLAKDLQEAGVSTVAELKIIARKPEAYRTKIPVLTDLNKREEFLWLTFRRGLKKLMGEDQRQQSADNLVPENDPVRKFVRSLGGGECIDLEAFANGLVGAGITSERDLLVLSRNLDKYTKNIPFLREFAASKKFGWVIFQVGLEGISGRKVPASSQAQDRGAGKEGYAYIKQFLDTIDPHKPLGHLADGFIKVGLTSHIRLLRVAEDVELALDAMSFLRGLASGDQLVWAMVLVGLDNILKSK